MTTTDTASPADILDAIATVMSGEEWSADTLDTIGELILASGRTIDSPDDNATAEIHRVMFAGFVGDRWQPPEPADLLIRCGRAQGAICEAYSWHQGTAECQGNNHHDTHEVTLP